MLHGSDRADWKALDHAKNGRTGCVLNSSRAITYAQLANTATLPPIWQACPREGRPDRPPAESGLDRSVPAKPAGRRDRPISFDAAEGEIGYRQRTQAQDCHHDACEKT